MEIDLFTEEIPEDENYGVDDYYDEHSTFEGERCGICMDVIIDRGVLDCCQHWFCFACIDNWATITNLCPLCQHEFQLITCLPVLDTIGNNATDEESDLRDDDWSIEGKNSTLSFPSYYIDENAVVCLDGNDCKIRSGSATTEEDPNLDTSIACDSCDKWYHAFCVGFDTEDASENSWLCPRCVFDQMPENSDAFSKSMPNNRCNTEGITSDCLTGSSFCGKMSVSVADAGETAVVVSLIEGNQGIEVSSGQISSSESIRDMKVDQLESVSVEGISIGPEKQGHELPLLSRDTPMDSHSDLQFKLNRDDETTEEPGNIEGDMINHYEAECQASVSVQQSNYSAECCQKVDRIVTDEKDMISAEGEKLEKQDTTVRTVGSKRKFSVSRNVNNSASEAAAVSKTSLKKVKTEGSSQLIHLKDKNDRHASSAHDLSSSSIASKDDELRYTSAEQSHSVDIKEIVQGVRRKTSKQLGHTNLAPKSSKDNIAGLRVKKIMRRTGDDKDSSVIVQTLRKEIREAIRQKSSVEIGENLFDPKLLAAFRAVVAGPSPEYKKLPLDLKAKKLIIQKGKVRENLTKKIYGLGGRRRRAWTRDCEIEFWKHRCSKSSKPQKVQTLKSVLDLLRNNHENTDVKIGNDGVEAGSILSRLYLADASVLPRKEDIKPVSAIKAIESCEENNDKASKASTPLSGHFHATPGNSEMSSKASVPLDDGEKKAVPVTKDETVSRKVPKDKCFELNFVSKFGGSKVPTQEVANSKSDDIRSDKRKWALEVLARKNASSINNDSHEKEEDNASLKMNYPLLAELPKDMHPILMPICHNKIPMSIRQAQLYRFTEHFLKRANLPVIRRTAESELAVADAVNLEKQVADKSNSKLVYMNLCSQELLRRSDKININEVTESHPSANLEVLTDAEAQSPGHNCKSVVDEVLRNAGLVSDSPPPSPHRSLVDSKEDVRFSGKTRQNEPDRVFEVDSHADLNRYGDFENNLENDDFEGACTLNISEQQPEASKMELVFSALNPDKADDSLDIPDHEEEEILETSKGSPGLLDCHALIGSTSEHKSTGECLLESSKDDNGGKRTEECLPQSSKDDNGGKDLSVAECEEFYGPDKEQLIKKSPKMESMKPLELATDSIMPEINEDFRSDTRLKTSEVAGAQHCRSDSEKSLCHSHIGETSPVEEMISKAGVKKPSDSSGSVSKKVEAYIKEHIRPLCKSGVITVEQYRWSVGKTTEKVMKYHTKAKNANFLIKEGEKVKKLAEEYVEAAQKNSKKI